MRQIYAFVGVIGSGKDYQANLKAQELGCKIFDFSEGVREVTFGFLGYAPESRDSYEKFKKKKFQFQFNEEDRMCRYDVTGRKFLQNVGTILRKHDPDFWANYCYKKAIDYIAVGGDNLVFSAVRYLNEAQIIMDVATNFHCQLHFILTDFHSERYELNDHESELFAQYFVRNGYLDQEDITKPVVRLLNGIDIHDDQD